MHFHLSVDIAASPDVVWSVMAATELWQEWTPSVRSVRWLGEPLRIGSRALVRQPRFPPALWKVTSLDPGRSFAWRTGAPGAWIHGDHWVRPIRTGARATLCVGFQGPIARLIGRMTRSISNRYLTLEADGLKRRSEERARALGGQRTTELARVYVECGGLGIIFYSPWAVRHIRPDTDYLEQSFLAGLDIARHVNASSLTGFGHGSPGDYELVITHQAPDAEALGRAEFKVELGLEVRDGTVCFRDLYDLIRWDPECPPDQSIGMPDGFYRVIAYTTATPSDQTQFVHMSFLRVAEKPELRFDGAPQLC